MKNRIITPIVLFSAMIIISASSCEKKSENLPSDPVPINLTLKQESLIESENDFAFDIFRKVLVTTPQSENIVISPLSISYALSMTLNGAAGATRDSILKALRINGFTPDDLNTSYSDLTKALLSIDKRVLISIANSVWIEKNFTVKKPFTDILTEYYDAEAGSFDITDPLAHKPINTWIEQNTNGLIKEMIDKLSDNAVMLLVNAIYFKGQWKVQFDKSSTTQRNFTEIGGLTIQVPSMHQTTAHKIFHGNGFKMLELPYGQGNFVMDVLLPDGNDHAALSALLTSDEFSNWTQSLQGTEVNLYLPRFKYDYKKKLKEVLSGMGMGISFTDLADFSNISDLSLLINDVTHQAFIETNEEGTEAAAATVVEIGMTSAGPGSPLLFDVNRPFIYIIREVTTNSILFMGRISNPLQE